MIFFIILISCQKNNEIIEINKDRNELFREQESTDNLLDNENNNDKKLFSDDSDGIFPLTVEPVTPGLPYDDSDDVTSITIKPRTPEMPHDDSEVVTSVSENKYDLLYRYDGVGSIKFDEYFKLDN
jgi:hypothetical protein